MTHTTEQERAQALAEKHGATSYRNRADTSNPAFGFTLGQLEALISEVEQAARRAPAVPETIEQRAKKLKGLQGLTGATAGVPEAIALARSRFVEAYGRSPLHDDLVYACLLIDAYGGAPAAPVPKGDYLDGVNIPRLREALTFLGRANGAGEYEVANKLSEYVNSITRAVLACKELLRSSAPAAPVPQGWKLVPEEASSDMVNAGEDAFCGTYDYAMIPDVYAAMLAAAPQPPEAKASVSNGTLAAPVELPEPVAYMLLDKDEPEAGFIFAKDSSAEWHGSEPLYTEQQVRELLAANGIEVAP